MLLKLLFSINCQTTGAYRAIRSLHFHHLWVRHTVNYIIPPHMHVRHTVRMWVCHIRDFLFQWVHHLPPSVTVACRATKIPTTLRDDVPVAIRVTKNLEDTMLSVSYRSWQRSFSKITKPCQQWELTFLSTVVFRATKILRTLRVDVPVAIRATKNLEDTMLPVNYQSWQRSFQSYQNSINSRSWHSCWP